MFKGDGQTAISCQCPTFGRGAWSAPGSVYRQVTDIRTLAKADILIIYNRREGDDAPKEVEEVHEQKTQVLARLLSAHPADVLLVLQESCDQEYLLRMGGFRQFRVLGF
jgi:hypothetical protein